MRKEIKNMILLSGSGRNVGKTTLACNIIKALRPDCDVVAIKLSPHFHKMSHLQVLISEGDGYKVYSELDGSSQKDSSRMLSAGAGKVLFIQCEDDKIKEAFESILHLHDNESVIVCESGSLAKEYKPGMHLLIEGKSIDYSKESYRENRDRANIIMNQEDFTETGLNFDIKFDKDIWHLKKYNHDKT